MAKVGSTNGVFKPSGRAANRARYNLLLMSRRANLAPARDSVTDYE
jgi:hypothetical protein